MISSPSTLNSDHHVLVIDASVAINLLGTGRPADVLQMLNRKVIVDELALKEATRDPFTKLPGGEAMGALVGAGLISSTQLSASAFELLFLALTGAQPPDDLGDGEAATIAQAFDIEAVPVIDERKATRIALSLRPKHPILGTIDILGCSAVTAALSPQELGDIIYSALFHARMRVPIHCREWVCAMIGPERARSCPSLGSLKGFGAR
jgi:predicted nucleic acid-binding protein